MGDGADGVDELKRLQSSRKISENAFTLIFWPSKCSSKKSPTCKSREKTLKLLKRVCLIVKKQFDFHSHYLNVADEAFNFIGRAISESSFDDCFACGWQHHHQCRIDDGTCRQNSQQNEPEPQENVNFLIQNVQCKYTQSIVLLNGTGRSVLVECALCDARENFNHRIAAILLIHLCATNENQINDSMMIKNAQSFATYVWELNNVGAISHECSTQEALWIGF